MAVKTVRPNATVNSGGANSFNEEGKGPWKALSDNSDGSWVACIDDDPCVLGFPDLELPSGSAIKAAAIRVRSSKDDPNQSGGVVEVGFDGGPGPQSQQVYWVGQTTTTVMYHEGPHTEAEINGKDVNLRLLGNGGLRPRAWELYVDVTYAPKPTVAVIKPSSTTDNTPTLEWSNSMDSVGGGQTNYQVKVFDDATYGGGGFNPASSTPDYNSGILSGSDTSHTLPLPLENDTYKVYVRVAQTVQGTTLWSDWTASSSFVVSAPLPHSPIFTVTPEDDEARISVKLAEGKDGAVKALTYQVQRSLDAGDTWADARTLLDELEEGLLESGSAEMWDYEVPNGQDVRYRARSINNNSKGAWVEAADFSWESNSVWIKNVFRPAMNLHNPAGGKLRSFPSQTRDLDATVHKVLGRSDPIVVRDEGGPVMENGELVIMTETLEDREAIDELLESGQTLLLQFPPNADEPDRYIQITGSFQRERVIDKSFITLRDETVPWQEVAIPTGPVESWT